MADWSSIHPELVGLIDSKLTTIEDHSALGSLCRSYMSATKGVDWRPEDASQPPWLLLCGRDSGVATQRGLLSMYRHTNKFVMDLPELHGGHCWGTPYGWIVTLGLDMKLTLFNPFTRRRIPLPDPHQPSVRFFEPNYERYDSIDRAILFRKTNLISSSRSDSKDNFLVDNFLVVTISVLGELRVMRGETWVDVKFKFGSPTIKNVFCYRRQIYAVGSRGQLFICSNIDGPEPPTADVIVPSDHSKFEGYSSEKYYLVEVSDQLFMVVRHLDEYTREEYDQTVEFKAYKLNFETKEWIEIHYLGDVALFVGDCQSISLAQPENFNCRSNCIYFTDDSYEQPYTDKRGKDMGIYDFGKHTSVPFYDGDDSLSSYSAPTWFIPTFT